MTRSKHHHSQPQDSPHLDASVYTVFSLFTCHHWQSLLLHSPKLSLFCEVEHVIAHFLSALSKECSPSSQSTICPCPSQVTGHRSQVMVESLFLFLHPYHFPRLLKQLPSLGNVPLFTWEFISVASSTWDASFLLVANPPHTTSCTSCLFCSYLPLNCILLCKPLLAYLHSQLLATGNEMFLLVFCLLSYKQSQN